jgi:hypothetical protein
VRNNLKLTGLTPASLDENRRYKEYRNMEKNLGIFIVTFREFEGISVPSPAGALTTWWNKFGVWSI